MHALKGVFPLNPSLEMAINNAKSLLNWCQDNDDRWKGVKRQQSPGADDSVMIISDADVDCTPTGFPRPEILQEEGQVQRRRLKPIRLFQSPPPIGNFTSRRVDVIETIDLVDDDYYETISSDDEVVLLDEDNSVNNENDDVEIVGVRIVPKLLRSRSNSRSFTSPWIKIATRNSVKNNISFQNVQQSVRRAEERMSDLNISRTATSRIVKRKKKKKENQPMPRINAGGGTFQQQPQQQVYQNRYKKPRSKRTTVPVYLLDNELGPRNPEWNKSSRADSRPPPRAAEFIPISTINTINSGPVSFPPASSTVTSQCLQTGPDGSSDRTKIVTAPSTQPEAFNLMFAPGSTRNRVPGTPRPIIIDASNVAMGHGMNKRFSCRGIKICVEYFKRRGHSEIIAFVPRFRCKSSESLDTHILNELEEQGVLKYTPSREAGGLRITSYDDRFIVQYAVEVQGIIVTNDNYRDIFDQQEDWRDQIRSRLLPFLWISEDCIMFPWDPLGRHGPPLETFLRF